MSTGMRIAKFAGIMVLCLGSLTSATAERAQKKARKQASPPPLPSGPTGPIQQVPLDWMAPVAPQVAYEKGQLTIVAPNSTLGDILRAVRKQTGAEIEIPDAKERVVTHLGPGPARDVIAELLNGSRFNYVLLGSPQDPSVLTRVVLVAKTAPDTGGVQLAGQQQAAMRQLGTLAPPPPEEMSTDSSDTSAAEDSDDNTADQPAAEGEQPAATAPDQPTIKTPQQLLQEMQQRQLQMQQQQQQTTPGQPAVPVPAQRPPQEQQ